MTGSVEERLSVLETSLRDTERELDRVRERIHAIGSDLAALGLISERGQQHAKAIEELRAEVRAMKRAFYTFALSVTASAVVYALTIYHG